MYTVSKILVTIITLAYQHTPERVFLSINLSIPIILQKKLWLADNILDYGSLKLSFEALNQEIPNITNLEPN